MSCQEGERADDEALMCSRTLPRERLGCFEEELFMAKRRQKIGKIFYGWWIVLVAGIALSVHHAPIMGFTSGVFLKSLSQEFSWSRTQISLAFTLGALGITLAAPFLGRLVDRFDARRVILPATLAFGLGVLSL